MQENQGKRLRKIAAAAFNQLEFVINRVPIVIAIQKHEIEPVHFRQDPKAHVAVHDEMVGIGLFPRRQVKLLSRVHGMNNRVVIFAIPQKLPGDVAGFRTDLENAARPHRQQSRFDDQFPKGLHDVYPLFANECRAS